MLVISVWNPKGGQGKSLVSLNLAAAAVKAGRFPAIIDRDVQGTSLYYSAAGHLPFPVWTDFPQERPDGIDLFLIDHMANDRTLPTSSILVLPVIPVRSQFSAYQTALEAAVSRNKQIVTVVTGGDMRRRQERVVVEALRARGAFTIRASGVFSRADQDCKTIFDSALDHAYGIGQRRAEFQLLLTALLALEE